MTIFLIIFLRLQGFQKSNSALGLKIPKQADKQITGTIDRIFFSTFLEKKILICCFSKPTFGHLSSCFLGYFYSQSRIASLKTLYFSSLNSRPSPNRLQLVVPKTKVPLLHYWRHLASPVTFVVSRLYIWMRLLVIFLL